jgi:hypothetical protein
MERFRHVVRLNDLAGRGILDRTTAARTGARTPSHHALGASAHFC